MNRFLLRLRKGDRIHIRSGKRDFAAGVTERSDGISVQAKISKREAQPYPAESVVIPKSTVVKIILRAFK